MTIITVASSKGGVGKTTCSVSLASGLANLVDALLVDLDPQGHAALSFGLPVRSGLYDWLVEEMPLASCVLSGRPVGLTLLPGDSLTKTVERLYASEQEFERLIERLRSLPHDMVILDTAAGGVLQEAALAAADQVVVPFRPETLGLDGVYTTMDLCNQLAPAADITLLPTAFDARLREHRLNLQELRERWGDDYGLEEEFAIPARIAVAEAVALGKTIFEHNARGIEAVRVGYSHLMGRVMAKAGRDVTAQRGESNGNSKV